MLRNMAPCVLSRPRVKALQKENQLLKKNLVTDLRLDKAMFEEIAQGNF